MTLEDTNKKENKIVSMIKIKLRKIPRYLKTEYQFYFSS